MMIKVRKKMKKIYFNDLQELNIYLVIVFVYEYDRYQIV